MEPGIYVAGKLYELREPYTSPKGRTYYRLVVTAPERTEVQVSADVYAAAKSRVGQAVVLKAFSGRFGLESGTFVENAAALKVA